MKGGFYMGWRFVLSLFFALIVALFAIQNAAAVSIKFFIWNVTISQALVILISAIFGAITVMMLSLVKQLKLNGTIKNDKKAITALENENQTLKKKLEEATLQAKDISEKNQDDIKIQPE
ncbi:MAG: LapA family protein [Eubacteriales bacterium]|nr:LapA family protein [Eubacteriales bacterium]